MIKREHSTREALAAANGRWASEDVDARKAATQAADIAVAEAQGARLVMSKKEKAKMLKQQQADAAQAIVDEMKASKLYHAQLESKRDKRKEYKGLGHKVAAVWKEEHKQLKAQLRIGAAERRTFHEVGPLAWPRQVLGFYLMRACPV